MTWEGELRQLEEQLASGALSAGEYRVARDRLLMQSQSITGGAPHEAGPQHGVPSSGQASGHHGLGAAPPPPSAAEATSVMRPVGHDDPPGRPNQSGPGFGDPESTQFVPRAAGDARTEAADRSPWSDHGSEPVIAPDASWLRQGSNAFDTKKSHKGRIVGVVVVVVLVVGLAVAGVLYVTTGNRSSRASPAGGGDHASAAAPSAPALPTPPPEKPAPADNDHALIDPPGKARNGGGPFDIAELKTNGLLPKPVVAALNNAGMTKGLLKTTTDHGVTIGMYALAVADSGRAQEVAHDYATVQMEGGLPSYRKLSMVGVPVFSSPPSGDNSVYRSVYVLYNRVIIVEAFGPDRATVEQRFERLLQKQVDLAPPTVRGS